MINFNEQYTILRGEPSLVGVVTLQQFIQNVARQIGVIGIDINAETSYVIQNSIQNKLSVALDEYKHLIQYDRVTLTQYTNQYEGIRRDLLLLRFGTSKLSEIIKNENEGILLEDRKYNVQFDFDVRYISALRLYYPFVANKQAPTYNIIDRSDFDLRQKLGNCCLEVLNGLQELRIWAYPFARNFYGEIELTGIFNFLLPENTNLTPNYSLTEDKLFRCDLLTVEALQDIVAYKVALGNNILADIQLLKLAHDDAYRKLEIVKCDFGIKF